MYFRKNKVMTVQVNNLSEESASYRSMAHIYEEFSIAEDYPEYILKELLPRVFDKKVADIGCGNGKYLKALSPYVTSIIGLDKSFEQVTLAQKNCIAKPNILVSLADATHIPLPNHSVDVVMACWMLGTILEQARQEEVILEMKRICKPDGKIILIENLEDSQFEKLRGRSPDPLERTANYNNFLLSQGFNLNQTIYTYFNFESTERAKDVFHKIWKDRLVGEINTKFIEHKVGLFCYQN
jgi:ubiquinone/menaquinone biosynthesis C-methylase UbiE